MAFDAPSRMRSGAAGRPRADRQHGDLQARRVAGTLLVGGAVLFLLAVIPMPGIYGVQDASDRLARLHADETGFMVSQAMFGVAAIVVAVGYAWLAYVLRGRRDAVMRTVGSAGVAIGTVPWVWFMVQRAVDPDSYFGDYGNVPAYVWIAVVSMAIGLGSWGVVFIRADGPPWVGYVTVVVVVATVTLAVLIPEVVPPQLLYLPPLLMGSVVLRSTFGAASSSARDEIARP